MTGRREANDEPRRYARVLSAFALEDDLVYHTSSAYARGVDDLGGVYQWLDRAPRGRNEPEIHAPSVNAGSVGTTATTARRGPDVAGRGAQRMTTVADAT
jgi:hypothetical protein